MVDIERLKVGANCQDWEIVRWLPWMGTGNRRREKRMVLDLCMTRILWVYN